MTSVSFETAAAARVEVLGGEVKSEAARESEERWGLGAAADDNDDDAAADDDAAI